MSDIRIDFRTAFEQSNSADVIETIVTDMLSINATPRELVINIALESLNDLAEAAKLREEEKRLTELRKEYEAKAEMKKNALDLYMQLNEIEKVTDSSVTVCYKESESVIIDSENELSSEFVRIKKEADKNNIKKAIKNGTEVNGAHIEKINKLYIK